MSFKTAAPKGFTLVELLVVIGIIGILAAAGIVAINPMAQLAKARNAQRKADLMELARAVERYKVEHGSYPSTGGSSSWAGTGVTIPPEWLINTPDWIPDLVSSGEIKQLPRDPNTDKANPCGNSGGGCHPQCLVPGWNLYLYASNGVDFKILAHCLPEGGASAFSSTDPFYDPNRPTWAWQVSSSDTAKNFW